MTDADGAQPRAVAAGALAAVLGAGRSLDAAFADLAGAASPLARELAYGVCRFAPRLGVLARGLFERPMKPRDRDIDALLWIGIYQLEYLRVPAHAAVHATVAAARTLGKPWAVGLLNAVLRRYQREREARLAAADADPAARAAHPRWLLEQIGRVWPDDVRTIVEAGNARPPMWLRVTRARTTRADFQSRLTGAGIGCVAGPEGTDALRLDQPVDVAALPGFADGLVSIQDLAAQRAAPLLGAQRGQRVLDACAAPGGKTAHLLELADGDLELVAIDRDAARLDAVRSGLARLGLRADCVAADAAAADTWWDGRPFDRILLDAPCSATGVIRRHPDIKLLRRPADIAPLAARQRQLLDALWPTLAPGGLLLYATCSILPAENAEVVAGFLAHHADARSGSIDVPWGRVAGAGRQLLPGDPDDCDGFFFAQIRKAMI